MGYIQEFLKKELLFTSEAAKYLKISKQRLSILVQEGRIKPIKQNKNCMIFFLQDLKEFRGKTAKSNILKNLIGITSTSLSYYYEHKKDLGNIYQVLIYEYEIDAINDKYYEPSEEEYGNGLYRLDIPLMIIKGDKNEMWLGGCTCGYSGTGPSGAVKILTDLGIINPDSYIGYKSIEFVKINSEWKLATSRKDSIEDYIDKRNHLKFFIKNNHLILLQQNNILDYSKIPELINSYKAFMPNPSSIIIFRNWEEAFINDYYIKSFEVGHTIKFPLIIEDKSGNQIWLPYLISNNKVPTDDLTIKSILELCDFPTTEISKFEHIRNWINLNIFNKPLSSEIIEKK
ncbi:MAG: helix-turn-helix domain-containing protein [Treponema sp.]|nr:helix-turn-helix domain-containing protein [Treponema sp.]